MEWFDGRYLIGTVPEDAIRDCSAPGADASWSVHRWVRELGFEAPADLTRAYLKSTGGWGEGEPGDEPTNTERLFWIICGDLHQDPDTIIYLDE